MKKYLIMVASLLLSVMGWADDKPGLVVGITVKSVLSGMAFNL